MILHHKNGSRNRSYAAPRGEEVVETQPDQVRSTDEEKILLELRAPKDGAGWSEPLRQVSQYEPDLTQVVIAAERSDALFVGGPIDRGCAVSCHQGRRSGAPPRPMRRWWTQVRSRWLLSPAGLLCVDYGICGLRIWTATFTKPWPLKVKLHDGSSWRWLNQPSRSTASARIECPAGVGRPGPWEHPAPRCKIGARQCGGPARGASGRQRCEDISLTRAAPTASADAPWTSTASS